MSSGDDLDITLSGLLLNKVEEQPQPVGMDAIVDLLEEVKPSFTWAKQGGQIPRKRRVPSEALYADILRPLRSTICKWTRPLGSLGKSKSLTSIGVSSCSQDIRFFRGWSQRRLLRER